MNESRQWWRAKDTRRAVLHVWRRKAQKWLADHDWQIVAALWGLALVLGYVGFAAHSARHNQNHSIWDNFYLTLQLFTMESGSVEGINNRSLGIARFLAPVAALYTAIITLALVFREQIQMLSVRFISKHVVICGLGRRGLTLATSFLERGFQVVVIERDQSNELIMQCMDNGAIVIVGNASDQEILLKAGVDRAEYLISVCGEDGINAEVAVDAREISSRRKGDPLKCVVEIDDFELCRLLKGQELGMIAADRFRLEFFNSYLRAAK
ncbi:MAG: NAD(P)-binding protein, partial [Pseudomonadota bacterium]